MPLFSLICSPRPGLWTPQEECARPSMALETVFSTGIPSVTV